MTRGTVFNAGDDYPNAEASPGLSAEDARIELLFIERAQAGVVVHELGRQRREGKTVKLCMTLPLRVALDQGFGDFRHGSPLPQNMPQIGAEMSLEMLLDPKTGKKNIAVSRHLLLETCGLGIRRTVGRGAGGTLPRRRM